MKITERQLRSIVRRQLSELRVVGGGEALTGEAAASEILRYFKESGGNIPWTAKFLPTRAGDATSFDSPEGGVEIRAEMPMVFRFYITEGTGGNYIVQAFYGDREGVPAFRTEEGISPERLNAYIKDNAKEMVAEMAAKRIRVGREKMENSPST